MTIIVKRINFIFDEKECQLINFTDVTAYTKLQKEEDTNRLLKTLNTSVHHEMLVPIKTMIEIAERLIKKFKSFPQEKKMVETILLSSQLILMHAHDFLDQQIIEHGNFVPYFEVHNMIDSINEMVQIMNFSVQKRKVRITLDKDDLQYNPVARIDKRRLQQVLLNLLSNACKFQTEGIIQVKASLEKPVAPGVDSL